jgi:hypothetical protein
MADLATTQEDLALTRLTADEHIELERYRRSGKPPLSPNASIELYTVWMQGVTCEELVKLNPGLNLGCILMARVDHRWDERRDAYLAEKFSTANDRLKQIGAEALSFLGLTLAVTHKQQGEKMARYLKTGNPDDLGTFHVQSIGQYKQVVETIARLTGADRKVVVQREGGGLPSSTPPETVILPVEHRRLTPEQADSLRRARMLAGKK